MHAVASDMELPPTDTHRCYLRTSALSGLSFSVYDIPSNFADLRWLAADTSVLSYGAVFLFVRPCSYVSPTNKAEGYGGKVSHHACPIPPRVWF
jgi:hypothetical protein